MTNDINHHLAAIGLAAGAVLLVSTGPISAQTTGGDLAKPELKRHVDLSAFADDADYFRSTAQFGDLDNDGEFRDFIRYVNSNRMQAFAYRGEDEVELLWEYAAEVELPRPSNRYFWKYVIWDLDRDGRNEVIGCFASDQGVVELRILDAATGAVERRRTLPIANPVVDHNNYALRLKPIVADLRGRGHAGDIVLVEERDSNGDIYTFDENLRTLWDTTDDHGVKTQIYAHYPWAYDLDADGRDELIGSWIFDDDGRRLTRLTPAEWRDVDFHFDHLDRAVAHDFLPDRPGVEVLASYEYLYAMMLDGATGEVIWRKEGEDGDAKLKAVGDWLPDHPGIEIAVNHPLDDDETALLLDLQGNQLADVGDLRDGYPMDWDGDRTRDESHGSQYGDLSNMATGERIELRDLYRELAHDAHDDDMRIYSHALDILGDYREEIVLIDENEMLIFGASGAAPADHASPWLDPRYRLAMANVMNDNHPERNPWFDWRDIGQSTTGEAGPASERASTAN